MYYTLYKIFIIIISVVICIKFNNKKLKQVINTKYVNDESVFKNMQLDNFIKMFDKDYRPSKVLIYNKRIDVFKHIFKVNIIATLINISSFDYWKGNIEGSFNQALDTVSLYIFAEKYDDNDLQTIQLYSLHTFAHELRHRKQYINFQNKEKDANDFATNIINNKSDKVSKIMNWNEEWEVEE
jgi:hypothetical protein